MFVTEVSNWDPNRKSDKRRTQQRAVGFQIDGRNVLDWLDKWDKWSRPAGSSIRGISLVCFQGCLSICVVLMPWRKQPNLRAQCSLSDFFKNVHHFLCTQVQEILARDINTRQIKKTKPTLCYKNLMSRRQQNVTKPKQICFLYTGAPNTRQFITRQILKFLMVPEHSSLQIEDVIQMLYKLFHHSLYIYQPDCGLSACNTCY